MPITTNINEAIKGLSDLEKKQIPYATSVALNNTAEIAMSAMTHKIDKDFDVHGTWNKVGGKFGIKKRRSTKRNLEVEIYIPESAWWLDDHEDGGMRHNQLVPTHEFHKLFPNLKTNKAIKKKAQRLLSDKPKNRIFEAPLSSGFGRGRKEGSKYGTMAIFQRKKGKVDGTRRRRGKSGRLLKPKKILNRDAVPLFIIAKSVKEKPILEFYKTIPKVFQKNINKEFDKALKYAISTAK